MSDIDSDHCPNCSAEDGQVYNKKTAMMVCEHCGASYDNQEIELPDGTVEKRLR